MVYVCNACNFMFERVSEWPKCPDCGKEYIRNATEVEIEEYNKNK